MISYSYIIIAASYIIMIKKHGELISQSPVRMFFERDTV